MNPPTSSTSPTSAWVGVEGFNKEASDRPNVPPPLGSAITIG